MTVPTLLRCCSGTELPLSLSNELPLGSGNLCLKVELCHETPISNLVAQSCPTFCDPVDYSQAPLCMDSPGKKTGVARGPCDSHSGSTSPPRNSCGWVGGTRAVAPQANSVPSGCPQPRPPLGRTSRGQTACSTHPLSSWYSSNMWQDA